MNISLWQGLGFWAVKSRKREAVTKQAENWRQWCNLFGSLEMTRTSEFCWTTFFTFAHFTDWFCWTYFLIFLRHVTGLTGHLWKVCPCKSSTPERREVQISISFNIRQLGCWENTFQELRAHPGFLDLILHLVGVNNLNGDLMMLSMWVLLSAFCLQLDFIFCIFFFDLFTFVSISRSWASWSRWANSMVATLVSTSSSSSCCTNPCLKR